jgi:energy-coupling factor transport system permease protein
MTIIFISIAGLFKIGKRLIVDGLWRFKVLLILVVLFNFWQGNSVIEQAAQVLKLANTLLLSVFANYLTDFPKLLKSIDYYCNYIKPLFIRTATRKIIYTILLAIRFVPELWNTAEKLVQIKKMRGWQPQKQKYLNRIAETARLIIPLLILTGKKATELETVFYLKGMRFAEKRTIWQAGNPSWRDWGVVIVAILILLPIEFLKLLTNN